MDNISMIIVWCSYMLINLVLNKVCVVFQSQIICKKISVSEDSVLKITITSDARFACDFFIIHCLTNSVFVPSEKVLLLLNNNSWNTAPTVV